MNEYSVLYFTSILLAALVIGYLADYARRHRHVTGAVAFACTMAGFFLLVFFEGLSMIGPTREWAIFFFNLRYAGLSFFPVCWLIFVVQYIGKSHLLTKKRVAFLLIIPILTQVIIWTNGWHGLWVRNDVAFHQIGLFYVSDVSPRIPGPWIKISLAYTYILVLLGLTLLAAVTVRFWKNEGRRNTTIIAGIMIMIISSLFPAFNIFPVSFFNPLPAGYAAGSLVIAWGVFRYDFLLSLPSIDARKYLSPVLIVLFFWLAGMIIFFGYIYYSQFEKSYRVEVERKLTAVIDLKVQEIKQWRQERLADATLFFKNKDTSELTHLIITGKSDARMKREMKEWLVKYQTAHNYKNALLLDKDGGLQMSAVSQTDEEYLFVKKHILAMRTWNKINFVDFHRAAPEKPVYLMLLIPIKDQHRRLGVVALEVDPAVYLYPFLQHWPTASKTGETLLVRREDDNALYLNELRFQKNTALNLRLSLENRNTPAVMAVLGHEGVMEGKDYGDKEVIAALKAVPDSPWFMVAKIEKEEIVAPLRERFWMLVFLVIILIAGTGTIIWLIWQRQNNLFYLQELHSAQTLHMSESLLDSIIEKSPHPMWISDEKGTMIRLNEASRRLFRINDDEVIGKYNLFRDDILEKQGLMPFVKNVFEKGETAKFTLPYDSADLTLPLAKTVSLILEVTVSAVLDQGKVTHAIIQHVDVTEHLGTVETLRESEKKLREVQEMAHLGFWSWDVKTGAVEWSEEVFKIFGRDPQEFVPHIDSILAMSPWSEDHKRGGELIRRVKENHKPGSYEQRFLRPDQSIGYYYSTFQGNYDEKNNLVSIIGTVLDITERKQAEEKINQLNAELEQRVLQRTAELSAKTAELERLNRVFVDRELRMQELKMEIARLENNN